ncbi:YjgP/YjgQ family permease [Helicobacter aurati]|uniref:YjgP/YjgQ family permease n=1 Tax=Helicobacter aurati TaxID=137778 RepID=A0A3D8J419_9HELI|nr:LptF/LptG family permease [Helicobacter aurati]RDU71976.1 YjgP/YjgQ family permease [Helicobacter aurati]
MYFWFIGYRFLKPTIAILFAMEFFFVCIDSLQYIDKMPNAANLIILFLLYDAIYALNYVFPLSLLLGLIVFYLTIIKSNQYIALLSLGYSKKQIFFIPTLFIMLSILGYIGLNCTSFAYAEEKAQSILNKSENAISNDLFIRYGENYVFFAKVYPLLQKAEHITVYRTIQRNDRELVEIIESQEGYFYNDEWNLVSPKVIVLPENYELGASGMEVQEYESIAILRGFRPKILDTIYQNKPLISILDAFSSLQILSSENSDTSRVRGVLYTLILVPFFIPMLSVIIAYYMPPLARYGNITVLGILLSVLCLITWGIFFSLGKLQAQVAFLPEIGILVPLGILCIASIRYYFKL